MMPMRMPAPVAPAGRPSVLAQTGGAPMNGTRAAVGRILELEDVDRLHAGQPAERGDAAAVHLGGDRVHRLLHPVDLVRDDAARRDRRGHLLLLPEHALHLGLAVDRRGLSHARRHAGRLVDRAGEHGRRRILSQLDQDLNTACGPCCLRQRERDLRALTLSGGRRDAVLQNRERSERGCRERQAHETGREGGVEFHGGLL